ncbi:MAG: Slp family lipoprotein [Thalassotalea sp.]
MIIKIFQCAVLTMFVSACSLVPEEISTEDDNLLVSYQDAKQSPEVYNSMTARWGGVIASIKNLQKNTVIEVVNIDLSTGAKPKSINKSAGRFRIVYPGLLDPMIFQKGKQVTAVGKIALPQAGKIGELDYVFPVLEASGIYLWKEEQRIDLRVKPDPYMSHFYDPFYRHPYPVRTRTVIVKKPAEKSK